MIDGLNEKVMLHAVMRHDGYIGAVEDAVTIVAIVPTRAEAEREVARLNRLKKDSKSTYFWLPPRYYPDGRGVGDAQLPITRASSFSDGD